MTPKISKPLATEAVYDELLHGIIEGTYPPTFQLKQADIAIELGVSQSIVREALGRLEEAGLVISKPHRGKYVVALDSNDISEIYQIRVALEELAVKLAGARITDGQVKQTLKTMVERIQTAAHEGNQDEIVKNDLDFHRYVVELSNSSRLLSLWDHVSDQSYYLLRKLYAYEASIPVTEMASTHVAYLDALSEGDYAKICEAIEEHMDFAADRLIELLPELEKEYQGQPMETVQL